MGRLTNALIVINIAIFLLVFSMPENLMNQTFAMLDFSGATTFEVWRWFTSLFMHANASHLFFNMLALLFFGRVVEEEMGPRRFMAIYMLSGLVGNLAFVMTSSMEAVGASGCIFGLMGAAMLKKPKEMINLYFIPLPLGLIAILYIISQAALATVPVATSGIAYMAHVGGLLTGSLLAFYYEPKDAAKGVGVLIILVGILLVLWPVLGLLVGIAQAVLSVIDFIVGVILYGISTLLLSWIWAGA